MRADLGRGNGPSYELDVLAGEGEQGQGLGAVGVRGELLASHQETRVAAYGGDGGGVGGGGGGIPDNKSPIVCTKYLIS